MFKKASLVIFPLLSFFLLSCARQDRVEVVLGSYSSQKEEGIKLYSFDQNNGSWSYIAGARGIPNPSYVVPDPCGNIFYAVGELNGSGACANALSYDRKNREIKLLNSVPTYGADPCNIIISPNGKFVLTSNYSGGSITIFPVKKDGSLSDESHLIQFGGSGPDTIRQATSHIHCIAFSPDSTRLFADDLGADKIHEFTVNNQVVDDAASFLIGNKATDIKVAAGSGPRHITFGINGEYAYLINELSGNVITFRYADSTLRAVQYILADSSRAGGSADIHISPDGKFLYTSHRLKDDGISIFRIKSDGLLVKIGYQPTLVHPRNFAISPNGKFLLVACRDSNVIQVFKRNPATGMLTDMHKNITMNKPSCIRFIDRD